MKSHHNFPSRALLTTSILASLLAVSGSVGIAFATTIDAPQVERKLEVNTVLRNADGEIHLLSSGEPPNGFVSKGGDGKTKVIETAEAFAFSSTDQLGGDVNVIVSSALASAFGSPGATNLTTLGSLGGKAVKNAPYSAEIINERIQQLADGNQIVKRTSSFSARDSAGRTRTESRDDNGVVKAITIADPIEGQRIVLSPQSKSAMRISLDKEFNKRIEEIRDRAKRMALDAKDGKAVIVEGNDANEVRVMRSEAANANATGREVREEVRVFVNASSDGKSRTDRVQVVGAPTSGVNTALASLRDGQLGASFQDLKYIRSASTKDLGVRDIEGVRAEGKLRSYTIPAGEIGNKTAITVSTETWTSPDLGITVYSKHSDPRSGDTIYRLANVKRGEQAMALFTVPDGYSVKDTPKISIGGGLNK